MPTLISKPRFILRSKTEPLPDEYRIATRHDVATFKGFLFEAMPTAETACLTDGWVDGCECGGNTGSEPGELGIKDLKDIWHKLGILKRTTHFVLCPQAEDFPLQYRLATRLDTIMHKEFMWEVVPSGQTAYLDDGWVDSGYLQCQTGPDSRQLLPNKLGILMPYRTFSLQQLSSPFDPHYRSATRHDVKQHMKCLAEVMPAWETAHLADGWVSGQGYGGKVSEEQRSGLKYKLGVLDLTMPVVKEPGVDIVLDPTGELDQRLTSALLRSRLTQTADLAPVTNADIRHRIRKLCSLWNLDIMLHGMTQAILFNHAGLSISLRCEGITGECPKPVMDEQGAVAIDDFYQLDIIAEDSGHVHANILVPVGKPIGAGAVRKAFMESLENRAVAIFVPAPIRLVECWRWVLAVEPATAERAAIFYAVI